MKNILDNNIFLFFVNLGLLALFGIVGYGLIVFGHEMTGTNPAFSGESVWGGLFPTLVGGAILFIAGMAFVMLVTSEIKTAWRSLHTS